MNRPAILVAALLLALLPAHAARWEQDSGGSSAAPAQTSPATPENSSPAPAHTQPASPADEAPSTAKPEPPAAQSKKVDRQKTSPSSTGSKKRRPRTRKPVAVADATGEPRKVVIRQGGTSETVAQIMPGMTQEEANRQRQETEQLLAETDSDLRQFAVRTLNSNQQETISQIRHYMDVARSALKDGDTQRAHTLAVKAHLLSDDLLKH